VSEELENSLQQAVETYLNDRLRSINEEVSRLQAEIGETLERLRESSNNQTLEGTALSAAIFAHLQTARGQRLTGASTAAPASQDARNLKLAIQSIEQQASQTEVLKSLLTGAVKFAERVALFVIKNDQAIGWRLCKASDVESLQMIGGVSLPLSSESIVTRAANSRAPVSANVRDTSDNQLLIDQLGGQPEQVNAIPLMVRGKVVAVLYADTASSEADAINADALEALARVAGMAVNITSVHRAPSAPRPEALPQPAEAPAAVAPEPVQEAEAYTPQVEAREPEAAAETKAEEAAETTPVEAAPETTQEMPAPPVESAVEPAAEVAAPVEAVAEQPVESAPAEVAAEPQPEEPSPAVQFSSDYATPLGSARRFGVSEPDLPIEVSEEERRLHNDARRFARLLVSEIKLYNESKVREGRGAGDLYDRLRDDIDRSRQMYDKRVAPPVAARHDYFHQELVNTLAEGDPEKLGAGYPGAAVPA
jgi:hypothetical protein